MTFYKPTIYINKSSIKNNEKDINYFNHIKDKFLDYLTIEDYKSEVSSEISNFNHVVNISIFFNGTTRDYFLTKVYCLSEFENIHQKNDINKLIEFHEKNKYLYKLYSHNIYLKLDDLVKNKPINFFIIYRELLEVLFNNKYDLEDYKNVLLEMMESYKDYINLKEIMFIDQLIKEYEQRIISPEILEYIVLNNLLRFNLEKLYNQTIFQRYPKQLKLELPYR